MVKSVSAEVPKCAENSLYKQFGLVFVLAFIQLPNTVVSSLGKGNEGPRLLPEIASLVNVWPLVVSVLLAPHCSRRWLWVFLMFVSDLVLGEAEFAPGLRSRKLGLGYLIRVCTERGICVIAPSGEKRYIAGVNNSSLSFSHFFQVWLVCIFTVR